MNWRIILVGTILLGSFKMVCAQDNVAAKKNTYVKDTSKHKTPTHKRNGYVAIMGGFGFPNGDFASNGSASSGTVFSICAAFPGIISHCGFAFKFDAGTNGINQNNFLNSLSTGVGFSNINYSFPGAVNAYSYKTLLTGLYLTYPGKHITIDGRILGGVMMATVPALAVNMDDISTGNSGIFYEGGTSGSAFAIDFGIEARYLVNRRVSIILSADYLHSVPSFLTVITGAEVTSTGSIVQAAGRQTAAADQPFDVFNLSIGVGYTISAEKKSAQNSN